MGYAQRTKGYRIWLIDENKLVETINVRFDENKRGINFRQKVNSNLGYNLNLPDYYDDEDDFDRVKDSLTSRLVSKTSTETPSTSEKPGVSSDNHNLIPCTEGFSDLSEQQEALMVEVIIPNCYKQAIRSRDASKWHDAMDKEINNYHHTHLKKNMQNYRKPPDGSDSTAQCRECKRGIYKEWWQRNKIFHKPFKRLSCNNRIVVAQRKHLDDFNVVELLNDWNVDVPSWKYPRNLESPRLSSPGFGNDSKLMVM
ncbi:gag_pre-integrs domain-containing protein [Trichonephila clavipes]|nr:gag_pre-integrs domain-containing protein [Trichonephila clavipes]